MFETPMGECWDLEQIFKWMVPIAKQMPLPLRGEHVVDLEHCVEALPFLRLVFAFSTTSSAP